MGVGGQRHASAALPPGMTRYLLYRRLGRPPGPVWTGAENLASTGVRSPDRPARSEVLSVHDVFSRCGIWDSHRVIAAESSFLRCDACSTRRFERS